METLRRLIERLFGPYPVTTAYGAPAATTGQPHYGIDIATPYGTALMVRQKGRVTDVSYDPIGGRQVEVEVASGHRVRYAHLSDVLVEEGAEVFPGQAVARSGASGRVTGPHAHVEVRDRAGAYVDPVELFAIDAGGSDPDEWPDWLPKPRVLAPVLPTPADACPPGYFKIGGVCLWPSPMTPPGTPGVVIPGNKVPGFSAPGTHPEQEIIGGAFEGLGREVGGAVAGLVVGAVVLLVIVAVALMGLRNVAEA